MPRDLFAPQTAQPRDLFAPAQASTGPQPWADVGANVQQNLAGSVVDYGKETLDAIMHPVQTAKGLYDLGKGGLQYAGALDPGPEMETAKAFGRGIAEDYGTTERFKNKLGRDPFGTVMDIALPLSLARAPWTLSRGERLARKTPSVPDLDTKAKGHYKAAEDTGHVFPAQSYQKLVDDLGDSLAKRGAHPDITPNTTHLLKEMDKNYGMDMPVRGMMTIREVATAAGDAAKAKDRALVKVMKKKIDNFIAKDVPQLAEGNKNYARARERERVEKLIRKGERKGSSVYTQSGPENALRRQFENVAGNEKQLRTYSPPVQEAIDATSRGTKPSNLARALGKYAPTSPMALMAGGGGSAYLGEALLGMPLIGPSLMAAGSLARAIATKGTRSRAHKAAALAGSGGKLPADVGGVEGKARLAAVLHELEENNERRNRGQH
jgi:hypothetical protein